MTTFWRSWYIYISISISILYEFMLYLHILWFRIISGSLIINQPCWKKYVLLLTPPGRSTDWIFSPWWMQVRRGAEGDWWDQFGRMMQRFFWVKNSLIFFGWEMGGIETFQVKKVGILLKTWRCFNVLRVFGGGQWVFVYVLTGFCRGRWNTIQFDQTDLMDDLCM